jgi:cobalamin synthase
MMTRGCIELFSINFSYRSEGFRMPLERTPERSKRVAIGEFILAIALVVVAAVTGIWFAYIVAAVALLFAAFVWMRANREINGRGGNKGASGS